MHIRLNSSIKYQGQYYLPGATLEVDSSVGEELLALRVADLVKKDSTSTLGNVPTVVSTSKKVPKTLKLNATKRSVV